jgi:hypothetical protein
MDFLFAFIFRPVLDQPIKRIPRALFQEVKRTELDVDRSFPSAVHFYALLHNAVLY